MRSYVTRRTYDSVYATDYWIKFFLGLFAGLILAELIPVEQLLGQESLKLSRPLLAMLGGFSVQAVYQILKRFVQTLETLVQGKPKVDTDSRQIALKDQANQQIQQYRAQFLAELSKVQKMIATGESGDLLKDEIDDLQTRHGVGTDTGQVPGHGHHRISV